MQSFIGQLAGILMIMLIVILLVYFIKDLGVAKETPEGGSDKKGGSFRLWIAPALFSLGIAFAYIMTGGIIYNFFREAAIIFSVDIIWQFAPFNNDLEAFSAYNLIVRGFAALLFDKQVECGLYLSLLCGVITGVTTYLRYKHLFGKDLSEKMFMLFACMPGMMYIFLPSPLAMFLMFVSLCLLADSCEKPYLALVLAAASVLFNISGIAVLIMSIVSMFLKFKPQDKKRLWIQAAIVVLIQIFIVIYSVSAERGSEPEYWIVLIPLIVPAIGTIPYVKKAGVYVPTLMAIALVSGCYLLDKMRFVL